MTSSSTNPSVLIFSLPSGCYLTRKESIQSLGYFGKSIIFYNKINKVIDYDSSVEVISLFHEEVLYLAQNYNNVIVYRVNDTSSQESPLKLFFNQQSFSNLTNLSIDFLRATFLEKNSNFSNTYKVYQYFRKRNWIVMKGLQFGAPFSLYLKSPAQVHSSFLCIIDSHEEDTNSGSNQTSSANINAHSQTSLTWKSILSSNRVANGVNKDLLIASLFSPNQLSPLSTSYTNSNEFLRNTSKNCSTNTNTNTTTTNNNNNNNNNSEIFLTVIRRWVPMNTKMHQNIRSLHK